MLFFNCGDYNNRIKPAFEKFNMVFNVPVTKMPLGLVSIIIFKFELVIVGVVGALALGVGMCFSMVWGKWS